MAVGSMLEAGNTLATLGSLAIGHGQIRWRRWSVAVAMVGRWLAFCNNYPNKATGVFSVCLVMSYPQS